MPRVPSSAVGETKLVKHEDLDYQVFHNLWCGSAHGWRHAYVLPCHAAMCLKLPISLDEGNLRQQFSHNFGTILHTQVPQRALLCRARC